MPVPAGKTSELLVRLALDAGVRVRSDRLIEDLWDADAVCTSAATRCSRRSPSCAVPWETGPPSPAATVATASPSTRPRSTPSPCCARRRDASHLLDVGDDRGAAALSASTLAMYRGDEVLPGAGDWAAPHRARLDAARLTLARDRAGGAAAVSW